MRLVIFDIDGTLTQTMKADEECFVRSLAEVCDFSDVDSDWSRYKHTTDFGIFREIHKTRTGRLPSPNETSRFRQHFVALLARSSSEVAFTAVTGAACCFRAWLIARSIALHLLPGRGLTRLVLKMASAGLCYDDYPAASSDDAFDRESIIRLSMRRAAERYGGLGSTVYVGDGVWDARACRNVGIPFVGIGTGIRATRLSAEGAVCVFPDFSDTDLFLSSVYEITNAA